MKNKCLVDLECVQWHSEDSKDIIEVQRDHLTAPSQRRKVAQSQLEEKRGTVQAPERKSQLKLKLEQGRSRVDQKLIEINQQTQIKISKPMTTSNCKKGLQISSMMILGLAIPDQGTMLLTNDSMY